MAKIYVFRRVTLFEKLLLVIGFAVTLVGFYFLNKLYARDAGISWALIQSMFLWLILLFIIILTDSNESIKEELSIILKENIKETQILREVSRQQLEEIKLLREDLNKKRKK